MTIYLIISLLAIAISAFVFFESLTVSAFSLVPIVIIALSAFQAVIFNSSAKEENDRTDNTAFSTHEIDCKATKLGMKYHALCKLAIIPLLFILSSTSIPHGSSSFHSSFTYSATFPFVCL